MSSHTHLIFSGGRKLNGVVYLYRISDPRMGGNAKKNLRMFRELCGESALKNVCIATTNWGRVTQEEGDMRERELRESPNLFKPLLDAGARLVRHDKGAASAQSIVDYLIRKYPTKLQIQAELDEGKRLDDTGAGSVLNEEIKAFMEKHEASMQALRMEMEEAEDAELLAELEEERQTKEQQLLKMKKDLHELNKQQLIEVGGGIPILFIAYWKWIAGSLIVFIEVGGDILILFIAHAKWILAGSFIVLVLVMVLAYWHEDSSLLFGSASICGTRIEHSFGLGLEVEVIISVTC